MKYQFILTLTKYCTRTIWEQNILLTYLVIMLSLAKLSFLSEKIALNLEMCTFSQSNIYLHQFWFENYEADLFEWSDLTISENTSCLEVFDSPRQTICQKEAKKDLILIETQTIFEDAKLNCNAIGGELFLPKNDSELDRLGNLIDSSKTCPNAILGGQKSNSGSKEIADIYGQVVNITRWVLK